MRCSDQMKNQNNMNLCKCKKWPTFCVGGPINVAGSLWIANSMEKKLEEHKKQHHPNWNVKMFQSYCGNM